MMQGIFPNVQKNEKIVVYCESGNRYMVAKSYLESAGFTDVVNGGDMEDLRRNMALDS